jgi:photosystem II stability/assembly factor-like uncharacterized protein
MIAASALAITVTGIGWLHPGWPAFGAAGLNPAVMHANYQVAAVDFIDPSTGWVVAVFGSRDYAVLHTTDGGRSWSRQLAATGSPHAQFIKFFDNDVGVFGLIGSRPVLFRTNDGGRTWTALPALDAESSVLSWSFVDSDYGWMLVHRGGNSVPSPALLYRTEDGGRSWTDLGPPVPLPDQAFAVHFSYLTTGWLASVGTGAYAYKTDDFGKTWTRVPLPAPHGGWPRTGQFFVAVQPTSGGGAVASVVSFPPLKGRTGIGATIRGFPPLTVWAFDGGRPHTYTYATVIDQVVGGPFAQEQAPNQTPLSTVDNGANWVAIAPPSTAGAIGYFDAFNWWWIGSGFWSSSADGGLTWTHPRGVGAIEPIQGSLQVLDRAHAWFAGSRGSSPVLEGTADGGVHWRQVALPAV